jgi:hypothetical protein
MFCSLRTEKRTSDERGFEMPQGQDDDDQGQGQGQGGKQQYVVKASFTDDKGKQWTAGTAFTGDEAAVRKALAAGQIAQGRPENKPA